MDQNEIVVCHACGKPTRLHVVDIPICKECDELERWMFKTMTFDELLKAWPGHAQGKPTGESSTSSGELPTRREITQRYIAQQRVKWRDSKKLT